jgi:hypothetical protein
VSALAIMHSPGSACLRCRASLKPITQLLPSFILVKADQARTLALHITMQALASEMAEQVPGSEVGSRLG